MGDMILGNATAYADAVRGGYTGTREEWEAEMANLGSTRTIAEQKAQEAKTAAQQATAATAVIDGVVDEVTALKEETQALHDEVMQQESSNKQDKDLNAIAGDVAVFDNEGNTVDSDIHTDDVVVHPGVYDDLNVGSAKNLEDIYATPVPAEFGHRTTAGKVSISEHGVATFDTIRGRTEIPNQLVSPTNLNKVSGNGVLEVTDAAGGPAKNLELRGASLVKNQLVANGDFGIGVTGWTVSGGYVSITDSVTFTYLDDASTRNILTSCAVVSGHVYIVGCTFKDAGLENGAYVLRIIDGASVSILADAQKTWKTYSSVFTATGSSVRLGLANYNGTISDVTTVQFHNVQLVDLTQLFNGNTTKINAVQTWEDLVAIMPEYGQYVAYNTGEVVGSDAGWECVGQLYAANTTTPGRYIVSDGRILSSSLCAVTDYIKVIPGTIIRCHYPGNTGSGLHKCFYDENKTIISGGIIANPTNVNDIQLTVPPGAAYVRDSIRIGDVNTYTMRGVYAELTPPAPLFSAGIVYDREDVISGKRTQRIGSYTFTGNEVWTKPTPTAHPDAFGCDISGRANGNGNLLLAGYVNITDITTFYATDKSTRGDTSSSRITIRDSAYTDIAAFAAHMAGKTIYYELATPVVTDTTPTSVMLRAGTNTFTQTSGVIRQAPLGLNYDGTRWNIPVNSASKYIVRTDSEDAYVTGVTSIAVDAAHHKVIDLTRWFGRGYEPTTLADFYALYPLWQGADIPYMPGSVANFKGSAIVSRFFNAYNHETGTADLLGGNQYQICGTYTSVSYETIRNAAETLDIDADGIFTPIENGVLTVVGGNNTDTCVHLTWSGYKNYGTDGYRFEKYGESVRELPVAEYFPNGMNGLWDKYDELTEDKRVMRYDSITFNGSENWRIYSNSNYRGFALDPATRKYRMLRPACASMFGIQTKGQSATSGSMCFWFTDSGTGSIAFFSILKTDAASVAYMQYMGFYDAATDTCDLEAFKAWLTKYPVTVVFDISDTTVNTNGVDYTESQSIEPPLNLSYTADDFGTEELLPRNTLDNIATARMDALIRYNLDFTRLGVHVSEIWNYLEDLAKNNDHYARTDGYYAKQRLGAATAENLIDPYTKGVERKFTHDSSCGTASIADNGTATVEKYEGRTINWNQYATNGDAHNGTAGWPSGSGQYVATITADVDNQTITYYWANKVQYYISGTCHGIYSPTEANGQKSAFMRGHIIMVDFWTRTDSKTAIQMGIASNTLSTATADMFDQRNAAANDNMASISASDWKHVIMIRRVKPDTMYGSISLYFRNYTSLPTGVTVQFRDFQVFDLTKMFGYGKEPRKIADFRALFPEPFYDYDPGTPMNYKGTGIKTVGFNQYKSTNAFIRVRPQAYQITGTYTSLNYSQWPLRTAPTALTLNQVTVFNTLYSYQNTYYTALCPIEEYDNTATYKVGDVCVHEGAWAQVIVDITTAEEWDESHWTAIGVEALALSKYFHSHAMAVDEDGVFTPPDFGWLYVLGGNDTDTCVHFTWSGYRNGDYEPYWESVRDIDVTRYFPDGMNGVPDTQGANVASSGYIGDELYNDKAVQRIQKYVFTGDESFTVATAGTGITNRRFGWTTQAAYPRDTTRNGYYDVFSNYLTPSGFDLGYNSNSAERVAIANGGACMWATGNSSSLSMVPPTTWGTITTVDAFKAKLKALYDADKPLVVWYILKTPVVTPINPAINLTYKVADFGTEAALPSAPTSFPVDAVIKYSTDYTRELTHMIEEDVRKRVDKLDEQMANKADQNGDYREEGLIANAAGNLIDANATPVPAQFSFRTTAGDASVAAQGVAEMQACRGTTHTWNQLAEDYHANTMDVFGEGQVTDAKGGALESNVFQGETIVSNQLVPDSGESATVLLESGRSYYTKIDDVESIVTGAGEELAVTAGVDKVMDLTLAYAENRPSTMDELKSRYPGVSSLGDYDKGHFVHASGGVWTTGVWNQLVSNGDFSDSKTGWTPTNCTWSTGTTGASITATSKSGGIIKYVPTVVGHVYYASMAMTQSISGWRLTFISSVYAQDITERQLVSFIRTATDTSTLLKIADDRDSDYRAVAVDFVHVIDLTALFGPGNEPSTADEVEAYCASIGHDLFTYQAYDAGTPLGGSVDLTGIELKGFRNTYAAYYETYNAETGARKNSIAAYVFTGNETWNRYVSNSICTAYTFPLPGKIGGEHSVWLPVPFVKSVSVSAVSSGYKTPNLYTGYSDTRLFISSGETDDTVAFAQSMAGVCVLYLTSTGTTTIQQQHLTLQPGFNAFYQASLGTLAIHDVMTYLGTEWTLKLGSGRKYLYRHNGEDTMLTPSSNMDQPIVSGDKLVDLTWLFGKAANVPATLEDCYALYPHMRGDMPYCASKMMNYCGTALKTVGFNQWDGTYSKTGYYLYNTGVEQSNNTWNITSYIRVVGGLEYEVTNVIGGEPSLCWYDIDKNFISGFKYSSSSALVAKKGYAPDNACYARFSVRPSEQASCVFHLCWRGYRNYGTPGYAYEPYKSSVRDMRVTDWFPDGLASEPNSGRYDELTQTKAIKRICRKVLTGTESWSGPANNFGRKNFTLTYTNAGATGENARLAGSQYSVSCNLMPTVAMSEWAANANGCIIWTNSNANASLGFMLPYEYANITTVAQLQAFLKARYESGDPVVLQWPLATPVETDISEEIPQLSYNYEDFGLEEIIPPNEEMPYTSPANLLIVYQKDFTRDIANLPENYISKESMADLNAQLGPALNGTISGEYNPTTGKFEFSFTRNPTVAALAADASAPSLNIGMTYTQSPTVNVTYTLPTPSDLTQDNVITIDFTSTGKTVTFKHGTTTLTPQRDADITTGKKVRYLCTYSFGTWCIFPLEVK